MTDDQIKTDMEALLREPRFLRFLYRHAIQNGRILDQTGASSQGRNLEYHEGRRDLALEMLADAEAAQPITHGSIPILTTIQILREAAQSAPTEKKANDRYDRHRQEPDDDADA